MPEPATIATTVPADVALRSPGGSSRTVGGEPPSLPDESGRTSVRELREIAIKTDDADHRDQSVGELLTSRESVSVGSSLLLHLVIWLSVFFVTQWLGWDFTRLLDIEQPPLQASLGEEDVFDDLAQFEIVGEVDTQFDTPSSTMQDLAAQLQQSDSAWLHSSADDVWKSFSANSEDGDGSGVLLKVPASGLAVTKGSFTAFTIPAHPKLRESYSIVIEVRLKNGVDKYRVSDLDGEVKGSDNYTQRIPYDPRAPNASGYPVGDKRVKTLKADTVLDVVDNRVQIIVKVPGAGRLVKDTIKIKSRKLKEEQELTLIFGEKSEGDDVLKTPADE